MVAAPGLSPSAGWLGLVAVAAGRLAAPRLAVGAGAPRLLALLGAALALGWLGPGEGPWVGALFLVSLAVPMGALATPSSAGLWLGGALAVFLGSQVLAPALGARVLWHTAAALFAAGTTLAWWVERAASRPAHGGLRLRHAVTGLLLGASAAAGWKAVALLVGEASHGSAYAVPLAASAALCGAALGTRWRASRPALAPEVPLAGLTAAWWLGCSVLARGASLLAGVTALFRHSVEAWVPLQAASFLLWAAVVALPAFFLVAALECEEAFTGSRWLALGPGAAAALGAAVVLGLGALSSSAPLPPALLLLSGATLMVALGLGLSERRGAPVAVATSVLAALVTVAQVLPVRTAAQLADHERLLSLAEEDGHRVLRANGVALGSDGADLDWQVLAPLLGVLGRPTHAQRALVLGAGTGLPVHALLAASVERVDVVVASPALREAAAAFSDESRAALADPHCHVFVGALERVLASEPGPWDAIVVLPDPEHGVSRERMQQLAARLAPGGRLVLVLSTVDSNDSLARLAVRTVRAELPHATLWLGPEVWALVASAAPQPWDARALADQLSQPELAALLARLDAHLPTTVLMRQAASDDGVAQWAGEGGASNSSDRDLLRFGAPLAALVGADATLPDERAGPSRGAALELALALRDAPLTAEQLRDGYGHLARAHLPNDPLLRSLAEAWYRTQPSPDSALALARAGLAQGSPAAARRALAPLIAGGERTPAVVSQWLVLRWAEQRRGGAPFSPVDVSDALALGREVLAAHPDDAELRAALARLEAAQ